MSINSVRAYVWAQLEYDEPLPGRGFCEELLQELYTRLSLGNKKGFFFLIN